METLNITLLSDGSSDKALIYVVKWLLDDLFPRLPNAIQYADFRRFKNPPSKKDVALQVKAAKENYPFDVLVYHRDAESNDLKMVNKRKLEVLEQIGNEDKNTVVCVVPVRMMETWLLISGEAIKKAAGNRCFTGEIDLPVVSRLEQESAPKVLLHQRLTQASGLKGRRLKKFNVHKAVHLVAENIRDYASLRNLAAFRVFESDLNEMVANKIRQQ